ncbi:MAG: DUF262 domain-containing protein [Devosia sp.]
MTLPDEVQAARKKVVTDGYEMSIGEVINLYKDRELKIDPVFQRLFRWEDERKTRFVESLLLGIPIPPIFVFQGESGVWELIDGLQRLSTILQLSGDLMDADGNPVSPLVLNGTKFLPSLDGKRWTNSSKDVEDGIGQALQIEIKRARIRVEILKSDSDATAKYELFQRLNTGGVALTEQEVRNSIAVSINQQFYDWLEAQSETPDFKNTTQQTEKAIESQLDVELVLRFLAFRHVNYVSGLDVHEYLDDALLQLATNANLDLAAEAEIFNKTFAFLNQALGDKAFRRWNGQEFKGKFLLSVFEMLATGVSINVDALEQLGSAQRNDFILHKAQDLWSNPAFTDNSGAGVRGTTRLAKLLPMAGDWMKP